MPTCSTRTAESAASKPPDTRGCNRSNRRLRPPAGRRRCSIAEDNPVNQRLAVALLAKRQHQTTVVETGGQVLEALARESFDLILMDLQMPGMGGLEATTAIRANEQKHGGTSRIIAMTAHAMPGDRERCLAAGMDDYLTKPIDARKLYALIEAGLAPVPPEEPQPSVDTAAAFDRAEVLRRLEGDDELLREVIDLFIRGQRIPGRQIAARG